MTKDILYSFRRCPYAIRVRWAFLVCEIKVELREIDLKNKPKEFLNKSRTKTVPILIKKNGETIEESLDIILWAISNSAHEKDKNIFLPENQRESIFRTIDENDNKFKYHLDRFKYSARFEKIDEEYHFIEAIKIIKNWDELLKENSYFFGENPTIADWCIWPFIRQFKIACESKKRTNYLEPNFVKWLGYFENDKNFKYLMHKYDIWKSSSKKYYFPIN
tara:strand:- start:1778 stop:2437 length:660 start_codon:yes stop_codon:yes gene_type:complete